MVEGNIDGSERKCSGAGNRLSVPTVRMMLLPKWASKVEKMGKNRQLGVVEKLRKSDAKLKN